MSLWLSSYPDDNEITSPAQPAPQKRGSCDFGWGESDSLRDSEEDDTAKPAVTEEIQGSHSSIKDFPMSLGKKEEN